MLYFFFDTKLILLSINFSFVVVLFPWSLLSSSPLVSFPLVSSFLSFPYISVPFLPIPLLSSRLLPLFFFLSLAGVFCSSLIFFTRPASELPLLPSCAVKISWSLWNLTRQMKRVFFVLTAVFLLLLLLFLALSCFLRLPLLEKYKVSRKSKEDVTGRVILSSLNFYLEWPL